MILIGITGKKRSGKDTLANMISAQKRNFIIHWYAEHLRDMAALTFRLPKHFFLRDELKDAPLERWGCTPRDLLIRLAKHVRGEFGTDFFVDVVKDAVVSKPWRDHIVADIRYDVEAEWIRSAGGIVVHVYRDGLPPSSCPSEAGIIFEPGDAMVNNSGSLPDLLKQAKGLVVV